MSCIFCDIVSGKIPSKKIYEDEYVLAFYDVSPQAPTHFLVIFKEHFENITKLDEKQFFLVQKVFEAIVKIDRMLNLKNEFRVVNNCGKIAGQTVEHVHFHVLSGRELSWPPG